MAAWPELSDELARKTIEVLHDRLYDHSLGLITDRELLVVCNSLYDAVSGLVPWDIANIILAAREELTIQTADLLEDVT